jgi:CRISPR type III-A-associated protein Csm2
MADTEQTEQEVRVAETPAEAPPPAERAEAQSAPAEQRPERKSQGDRPPGERPQGERRPQGPQGPGQQRREGGGNREGREGRGEGGGREGGGREGGRDRGRDRDERRGGERGRFEGPPEIDIEKLISDPLYLDNQAHGVVSRMRDMDSGTKSQLRRLYNAVRRAVRAPENERQQQFVMLRARLAYTIARHSLRSLDSLEKLLLQVTRKNDPRGYERFRDLFEAIVAYNE